MRLELYYDSTVEPFRSAPFQRNRIFKLLSRIKGKGVQVAVIDTADWNRNMRYEIYLRCINPSVYKRYRIRNVFGTARESGRYFGRQVPALLVYENDDVIDVYPHDEKRRIISIGEFLEQLVEKLSGGGGSE